MHVLHCRHHWGWAWWSSRECTRRRAKLRTTEENLDVAARGGHVFFNVLLGDEADAAGPVLWGVVEDVVDGEAAGVLGGKVVELFFEEDVVQVDVGVDKGEHRVVGRVLERGPDDLEHGRDAGAAGNHANVAREGGGVHKVALGAAHLDLVANVEQGDVAGDVALVVGLGDVRGGGDARGGRTLIKRSKWPRSSSLLVGV